MGEQQISSVTTVAPRVERQLGLPMAIALIVGNMIGAGIFLLPSQLAPYGRNALYGWLVTIAGVLCLAVVFMALSARMRGGPFAYVERAFGPIAAFLVMWSYLVGVWAGLPAIAIAGISYLTSNPAWARRWSRRSRRSPRSGYSWRSMRAAPALAASCS